MEDRHFYITIEVKAQISGTADNHELRRRILNYIHNEKQRENHPNATYYVSGERIMSINNEKGEAL